MKSRSRIKKINMDEVVFTEDQILKIAELIDIYKESFDKEYHWDKINTINLLEDYLIEWLEDICME